MFIQWKYKFQQIILILIHGLLTGDKDLLFIITLIEGLVDKNSYFVFKVDDNNFKLGETPLDVINDPIKIIEFSSVGGTHQFSLINPKINIVRNNNLVFGVGHSSLEGFEFKLFYDKKL